MATRKIVTVPDEILTKKCRAVEAFDERLWTLLDDMKETLIKADGAGLAAPQVAVLKRAAIVLTEETFLEMLNPVITAKSGEQDGVEGCLSVPGKHGYVKRPEKVTVEYQDRRGNPQKATAEGFTARAICHELDHLDGKLYTSLCKPLRDDD